MIRIFDFSKCDVEPAPFKLEMDERVREGFASVLIIRLGDFPPSVLAAMWHDMEFENDETFREVVAQVYYDNCGDDVADYYLDK